MITGFHSFAGKIISCLSVSSVPLKRKIRTDRGLPFFSDNLEISILSVWVPLTGQKSDRWQDPAIDSQTVLLSSLSAIPVTPDYFEAHMQHA